MGLFRKKKNNVETGFDEWLRKASDQEFADGYI